MPNFIRDAIDVVQKILTEQSASLLASRNRAPFAFYGRAFVGQCPNPPSCWVQPTKTQLGDDGSLIGQLDGVTVKIGVTGGDPELLLDAALDYVWAVDLALRDAAPSAINITVLRVFVMEHDYGPLYERNGSFARFPEVHLAIQREELPQ